MVVDRCDEAFTTVEPYRGVNANMHTVEAFLAASDVTGDPLWRARALRITERVLRLRPRLLLADPRALRRGVAPPARLQPRQAARPVPTVRRDGRSRDGVGPPGAEPAGGTRRRGAGLAAAVGARALRARRCGRLGGRRQPGFVYTTDWDGTPVVRHRMHWVAAEATATAAVLHAVTGDPSYASWYETWWDHIDLASATVTAARGGTSSTRQPAVLDGVVGQAGHLPRAAGHPRAAAPGRAVLRHRPGRWTARPLSPVATRWAPVAQPPPFRYCRRERGGGYGGGMVRARGWRWRRTGNCTPYGAAGEPLTSVRRGCGCRRQVCLIETGCCVVQVLGCGPRSALLAPSLVRGRSAQPDLARVPTACGTGCCGSRSRRSPSTSTRSVLPSLRAAASHRAVRPTPRPRWRSWVCAAGVGSRPGACCAATPGPWEGTTPSRCPPDAPPERVGRPRGTATPTTRRRDARRSRGPPGAGLLALPPAVRVRNR